MRKKSSQNELPQSDGKLSPTLTLTSVRELLVRWLGRIWWVRSLLEAKQNMISPNYSWHTHTLTHTLLTQCEKCEGQKIHEKFTKPTRRDMART